MPVFHVSDTRTRRRVVASAAILAFGTVAATGGAGQSLTVVQSGAKSRSLSGVEADGRGGFWAVGTVQQPFGGSMGTLAEEYRDGSWREVESEDRPDADNQLESVAVTSQGVWAVGFSIAKSGTFQTLVERWTKPGFVIVLSPNPSGFVDFLQDVTADEKGQLWAVGAYIGKSGHEVGLVERYAHKHWRWVKVPQPHGLGEAGLESVDARTSTDVRAVGRTTSGQPYALHWNGTDWQMTLLPKVQGRIGVMPTSLSLCPGTGAWMVGMTNQGSNAREVVERFQGGRWRVLPAGQADPGPYLSDVQCTRGGAWSVGSVDRGISYKPYGEHWNGHRWVESSVVPRAVQGGFSGLVAGPRKPLMAVGGTPHGDGSSILGMTYRHNTWTLP